MNFVFFGTPEFAAIVLENLLKKGIIPKAVVCNPDRPVGRKKIITSPEVKLLLLNHPEYDIKLLQPEVIDENFAQKLSSFSPDFFVVAAYAKIIPQFILDIPKLGVIGVHPSLLPKYRGASPIQSAILNGDEFTGVSLFMIDAKMDHGPVIASQKVKVDDKNYINLQKELAEAGTNLLNLSLSKFIKGEIAPQEQNHDEATFVKKFTIEDGFIDKDDLQKAQTESVDAAKKIFNKIQALNPEPGIWTLTTELNKAIKFGEEKRVKLLEAKISESGLLKLTKIQIEGKGPMAI